MPKTPEPALRERAVALARERGIVRTRDLTAVGVPRCYPSTMCQECLLVKVCYGLYRATELEAAVCDLGSDRWGREANSGHLASPMQPHLFVTSG
ncbi:hypothetical protein F2981_14375 [Sinorhizobium meliloti]|nr:hypothetical protein [Sinorhizobium meliloti]